MNIIGELKFQIKHEALGLWTDASGVAFDVAEPTVEEYGDLACNIAMVLAKKLRKPPLKVAEELICQLQSVSWFREVFDSIEVKKPGFINFFLNEEYLMYQLENHCTDMTAIGNAAGKIVIEHTNVNPNKAMHIGHLRNTILGDVIQRILERAGYATEVQYYVDDTGVQVADTYVGLQELDIKQQKGEKYDHYCWRVYAAVQEAYEKDKGLLEKRNQILHKIEDRSTTVAKEVQAMAEKILRSTMETTHNFHISYDLLVWESDVLGFGLWESAFEILKKSKAFSLESKGSNKSCWVLKSEETDDDDEHPQDKIIVKSDGTVTYTGKDIAYHLWKYHLLPKDFLYSSWPKKLQKKKLATTSQRGKKSSAFGHADYVYNVIDVRQSYPQAMVKYALQELGYETQAEQLRHVAYGVVSLSAGTAKELGLGDADSSPQAMSGRKGIGIKADELLEAVEKKIDSQQYKVTKDIKRTAISPREVAVGSIKYFMLQYNPLTDIIFDYEKALSLEGNTGPYIQYAHARAVSILDKAGAQKRHELGLIRLSPEEHRLLKKIYLWPSIVAKTADDLSVNALTNYAYALATAFNSFYESQPVLKADRALRQQRLALVRAYRLVLADVLHLCGIEAPDTM